MLAGVHIAYKSMSQNTIAHNTVNHVFKYLGDTIYCGIHYWRPEENLFNPTVQFPEQQP